MTVHDREGHVLTGASPEARDHYERGLDLLRCYIGDPLAAADAAIAAAPDFAMAHLLRAWLLLVGTEPAGFAAARDSLAQATPLVATARERGHAAAAAHLVDGGWHESARTLQRISIDHPRDLLALQIGHQLDFFTGDARMLRDRIARALPEWREDRPGYHAMLSMHAFGLEECGDYARAERSGKRAVELQPRDGWGQHAVAHVLEMQARQKDGIAWMRADSSPWSLGSFFAVHNWWHLALYHLDLGEIDDVLALFDGPVYGARSAVALDMVDASALLWRLKIRDVEVGDRWRPLADNWAALGASGLYAFNDLHAVIAYLGAGQPEWLAAALEGMDRAASGSTDNARFTREVGRPAALALKAFVDGDYARTVELLAPTIPIAHRFGGSHAQRDLLDLTLIEAAMRAGDAALARALTAERRATKPASLFAETLFNRARSSGGPAADAG
jgi:hypothetical protein